MNWMRWKSQYFLFSGILILLGFTAIARGGLQPAVEFTGGSELTLAINNSTPSSQLKSQIQQVAEQGGFPTQTITQIDATNYRLELPPLSQEQKNDLLDHLTTTLATPISEREFQTVGPSISQQLITKTLVAVGLAVAVILLYVWYTFKNWRYGLAAVLAMLHDSLILLGSYAWLGVLFSAQVDVLFVTAVLTILSFSVHDTIVVFDRIRELTLEKRGADPQHIASLAITQTLPRSINNSLTILFMLLALLLLGGESIRFFVAALFIGTCVGTYSSTFTAVPLWLTFLRKQ